MMLDVNDESEVVVSFVEVVVSFVVSLAPVIAVTILSTAILMLNEKVPARRTLAKLLRRRAVVVVVELSLDSQEISSDEILSASPI